jgi:hypothetical protein
MPCDKVASDIKSLSGSCVITPSPDRREVFATGMQLGFSLSLNVIVGLEN